MKQCTRCGCEKPLSEFGKHKANPDGHQYWCKACKSAHYKANKDSIKAKQSEYRKANLEKVREAHKRWEQNNPEKMRAYKKKWEENNKDKVAAKTHRWYEANRERKLASDAARSKANPELGRARNQKWREAHPEKARQAYNDWRVKNPAKLRELWAKRRAAERKATPRWANKFFIEEAYELAALRTKVLGFDWHVDHIVPLRSKKVCGLHVEHNLQVIPAKENLSKGNRHWPNMP